MGQDDATPVTEDYKERDNKFTGKIHKITVQLGKPNVGKEARRGLEELRRRRAED